MDFDNSQHGGSGSNEKEDTEIFESTIDKTFQRFADRLAQNPLQVLRYEYGGIPLLYSKDDAVGRLLSPYQGSSKQQPSKVMVQTRKGNTGIPACTNCGGGRVFELQVTPQAIAEVEVNELGLGLDGMEWGTIILGTCGSDCLERSANEGEVGYTEEWCGVQWEERAK